MEIKCLVNKECDGKIIIKRSLCLKHYYRFKRGFIDENGNILNEKFKNRNKIGNYKLKEKTKKIIEMIKTKTKQSDIAKIFKCTRQNISWLKKYHFAEKKQ